MEEDKLKEGAEEKRNQRWKHNFELFMMALMTLSMVVGMSFQIAMITNIAHMIEILSNGATNTTPILNG